MTGSPSKDLISPSTAHVLGCSTAATCLCVACPGSARRQAGGARYVLQRPARRGFTGVMLMVGPVLAVGVPPRSTASSPEQPALAVPGPRPFAPGVRIDWQKRSVHVDAAVVLRRGPLELLACSPHTREHESILVVRARPLHVFQAMGLVGLVPGSPIRYDDKTDRSLPPTGEPLEINVRYSEHDAARVVPVEQWLLDVKRHRPPAPLSWVFAGSRTFPSGRFGADGDGTVICVVDFETALIAVGSLHTADNDRLWLAANTEAIPPVGTACTLLIRSAAGRPIEVELAADGTLRRNGRVTGIAELARSVRRDPSDRRSGRLVLRARTGVPPETVEAALRALARAGIARTLIDVQRAGRPVETADPGK